MWMRLFPLCKAMLRRGQTVRCNPLSVWLGLVAA
jgi:hypothetical protein